MLKNCEKKTQKNKLRCQKVTNFCKKDTKM